MAPYYKDELFHVANSVITRSKAQTDDEISCHNYLPQGGTLCLKVSNTQVKVRHPCAHAIGSFCMVMWFQISALCQELFFPDKR